MVAISGAIKALQEKNRLLAYECTTLKSKVETLSLALQQQEDRYAREKDKWLKAVLQTMASESERGQDVKKRCDALISENMTLKNDNVKLRSAKSEASKSEARITDKENESDKRKVRALEAKVEALLKENMMMKSAYEKTIARLMEQNAKLEEKLNREVKIELANEADAVLDNNSTSAELHRTYKNDSFSERPKLIKEGKTASGRSYNFDLIPSSAKGLKSREQEMSRDNHEDVISYYTTKYSKKIINTSNLY